MYRRDDARVFHRGQGARNHETPNNRPNTCKQRHLSRRNSGKCPCTSGADHTCAGLLTRTPAATGCAGLLTRTPVAGRMLTISSFRSVVASARWNRPPVFLVWVVVQCPETPLRYALRFLPAPAGVLPGDPGQAVTTVSRPADYVDAHARHWRDGELLYAKGHWANASQLHGFSAECGIKAAMVHLGMPVSPQGRPVQPGHRRHAREIWPVFHSFAAGRRGARFLGRLPSNNPFHDWSIDDRYAASAGFGRSSGARHRSGADTVRLMVLHELVGTAV